MAITGYVRPQLPKQFNQVDLFCRLAVLVEAVDEGMGLPA